VDVFCVQNSNLNGTTVKIVNIELGQGIRFFPCVSLQGSESFYAGPIYAIVVFLFRFLTWYLCLLCVSLRGKQTMYAVPVYLMRLLTRK
jgi:hypothetical protein